MPRKSSPLLGIARAAAFALAGTLALASAAEASPLNGGRPHGGGGWGHHGGGWGHHGGGWGHHGNWGHRPHGSSGGYAGGCRMVRTVIHGITGPYITYKRVCYIY